MADRPIWRTETRRLSELIEWEMNPRKLTERQAREIGESLERFGFVDPLIINTDNSLIGGHSRSKVLRLLEDFGPDVEVDVRVPSRKLTPRECEELAIRLNKNTGEWDFDMLADLFDEGDLLEWGFTEFELGFDSYEPEDGEEDEPSGDRVEEDGEFDEDETAPPSDGSLLALLNVTIDEPSHRVVTGDVFRLGPHYLVIADVISGWHHWAPLLRGEVLFAPYPGPFVPLGLLAERQPLVMVQPDHYIAGHILDRWAEVKGEETIRREEN